jgi:hypothetical protein
LCFAAAALLLAAPACSSRGGSAGVAVHQMGERVQAGSLIYTILEVEWVNQLASRLPKTQDGKFAVIRLSITNSGNHEIAVPMLQLVGDRNAEAMEVAQVEGVEEWLGVLRTVKPAETIQGRIVFDVKPLNYKLRVTDAAEPDQERFALVAIPLRLEERAPVSLDPPGQTQQP